DPRALEVCKGHIKELKTAGQISAKLKGANDPCIPVVSLMMNAIRSGAEACELSFNPTVRDVMKKSLEKTIEVQGLQCTKDEALAACPDCKGTIRDVLRVVTTMSTKDLDESLGAYSELLPKLHAAADQTGCKFNFEYATKTITDLAQELKNAQVQDYVRYKVGPLGPAPKIEQAVLPGPKTIAKNRTELDPIRISSGIGNSTESAGKGSSFPPGLSVTDLGNGKAGFVYEDPAHKGQSLIGYQVIDPKTGEVLKTYAYPISAEDAAKIAKDPSLCADYIRRAQEVATESGKSEDEALNRGKQFVASLEAKSQAKDKADTSGSNTSDVAQSKTDNSSPATEDNPAFHVGTGMGSSNGVRSDGIATGTGLKYGSGTGLRGTPKMTPSGNNRKGKSVQAAESESAKNAAAKASGDPATSSSSDPVTDLASRTSLSEPNGTEFAPEAAPAKKGKRDSTKPRDPQEMITELASRSSLSEPNGTDLMSDPAPVEAAKKASKPASSQKAKPKAQKKAKAQAKPQAKKPSTQASTNPSAKKVESDKPASSSGIVFTSAGYGHVRYFVVNKAPYKSYIGRVIEVNGKTQVMMYNLDSSSNPLNLKSGDAKMLKAEFDKHNSTQEFEARSLLLAPGISNHEIEDALVNQVLKRP
ncbi:MAG: hypothetical protein ACJ763_12030, partial [Bdellovibrionia bacterium]